MTVDKKVLKNLKNVSKSRRRKQAHGIGIARVLKKI
ncbi:hypothetical protein M6K200_0936 [Staphylococcus aureus]|nr:hypothetical protein M6K200_0936 [Staphylococcus aureus]SBE96707.1 Uncharacterised protein [Staphylococcus aureus]